MDALKSAIEICGGQAKLAAVLTTPEREIKQAHVWNWLNRDKKVPPELCIPIERATNGQVTRYALRPDVFGAAPEQSAAA